jgi:1-acyl-sn-glycerol-3-phosphate acyltransferase
MTESTPNQAILKGSKTLAQVRMAFIMLTLFVLVLLSLLLRLVFFLFPRHLFLRFNVRFIIYPFSRLLMWIVGVKLVVEGKMPSSQHLIVSNHQGILDSLLHMAISPCMVISNMLIRNMKVIGSVMELLGFVFVDRSRRMSIVELLQPATSMITQSKVNMSFFPEGKSNNGVELLPFHAPFFKIAIDSGSGVQPIAFRWTHANGQELSKEQRITFTYLVQHGSIVQHLSNLLGLRKKRLVVKALAPISAAEIAEKNWTRKEVCQQSEDLIRRTLEDDTIW